MLMIYNNAAALDELPDAELETIMDEVDALMEELQASGELVGGQALADAATARTVRVRGGVPAVTDGPFAESKEQLAGYLIVDCETEERAVEIATRWPDARYWAMEVRPIMHTSGTEM
ncbi:YciI family protein [Actinocorallia longicatena]